MKGRINEIAAEWGMQPKKGGGQYGPAMKAHVVLESDEEARWVTFFKQHQIGDEVTLEKKGDYWNEVSEKQVAENERFDMLVKYATANYKLLKENNALLKRLVGEVEEETPPAPKPAVEPRNALQAKLADRFGKDVVVNDIPDEPDLSDIPDFS